MWEVTDEYSEIIAWLPEPLCCYLQTDKVVVVLLGVDCMCIQSFILINTMGGKLHTNIVLYHNVWLEDGFLTKSEGKGLINGNFNMPMHISQ